VGDRGGELGALPHALGEPADPAVHRAGHPDLLDRIARGAVGLVGRHAGEPGDGRNSPAIILISVDLPAPLGPSSPTMPPDSFQLTSDTPSTWPYHLLQRSATTTPPASPATDDASGGVTSHLPRRSAGRAAPATAPQRSPPPRARR